MMSNSLEKSLTISDSLLKDFMEPGFIPDVSIIQDNIQGSVSGPYLEILEQPKQRGFRFRYSCEGPSHGGLPGERSERGRKSFPSVQIAQYVGDARIVVSLVTGTPPYLPHAHSLVGKMCKNGVCTVQVGPSTGMTASFQNLGIEHVTKKNVTKVLMERYCESHRLQTATVTAMANGDIRNPQGSLDEILEGAAQVQNVDFDPQLASVVAEEQASKIRALAEEQAKSMNLSVIRLCFQAYLPDDNGLFTKALRPVFSQEVFDSKAPSSSQLKICRVDKPAGSAKGGDEVFLLCDKVQKEDIVVRFYEEDINGDEKWTANAIFSPSDVHRQYAIVFKTPAYIDQNIQMPVSVFMELRRKNGNDRSDPWKFTYTPVDLDTEQIGAKRRRTIPHFNDFLGGGGGGMGGAGGGAGPSSGDGGGGGGAFLPNFMDFMNLSFGTGSFSGGTQQATGESHGEKNAPQPMDQQGAQNAHELLKNAIQKQAMYAMLALNLAVRSSNAMRMFAGTGDIRYMLAVQQHLTAVQDEDGDSALHLAIINSQTHVVDSILAVMVDLPRPYISQYNYLRQTPLHLAVITRQPDIVRKLLAAGADPKLPDRHGNLPVHIACVNKDVNCLLALLGQGAFNSKEAKAKVPELEVQNYEGLYPLHLAVQSGSKDMVKTLCEHQANVNSQESKFGKTPLHLAVETKNLVLTGYLILDAKCDVDAVDLDGNTALHVASGRGMRDLTALLVAAGANTDAENSLEEKPLHLAIQPEIKSILICDESDDPMKEEKQAEKPAAKSQPAEAQPAATKEEQVVKKEPAAECEGDMERVDHYIRYKMAQLLDVDADVEHNWQALARKLNMASMIRAFAIQPSPTTELLNNYEACGGTADNLSTALGELKRYDALTLMRNIPAAPSFPKVPKTDLKVNTPSTELKLDSGLGSMDRSEGSLSPLPEKMMQLDENALKHFQHGRTDVH